MSRWIARRALLTARALVRFVEGGMLTGVGQMVLKDARQGINDALMFFPGKRK